LISKAAASGVNSPEIAPPSGKPSDAPSRFAAPPPDINSTIVESVDLEWFCRGMSGVSDHEQIATNCLVARLPESAAPPRSGRQKKDGPTEEGAA
jgi:hypothetical protein